MIGEQGHGQESTCVYKKVTVGRETCSLQSVVVRLLGTEFEQVELGAEQLPSCRAYIFSDGRAVEEGFVVEHENTVVERNAQVQRITEEFEGIS